MTVLVNNQEQKFGKGTYLYTVELNTGTAKLQVKTTDMGGFVDISETSVTTDAALALEMPVDCTIKAIVSDALSNVSLINSFDR